MLAVRMDRLQGRSYWVAGDRRNDRQQLEFAYSLGRVFSRAFIPKDSEPFVCDITSRLKAARESNMESLRPYLSILDRVTSAVGQIGVLPRFMRHPDFHDGNILIDDQGSVTGIVDWENIPEPEPFGFDFFRYLRFFGHYDSKTGYFEPTRMTDHFERAFWTGLMQSVEPFVRSSVGKNWQIVQTCITAGFFLRGMQVHNNAIRLHQNGSVSWPVLLHYEIPQLRGSKPAFPEEFLQQLW